MNTLKKLFNKIFSYKKTLILLLVAIILGANYIINGVQRNLQEMKATNAVTPFYFPSYPPVDPKAKNAAELKRGEYLVKAGDCIACHTNTLEKGAAFAGGLPMQTPFGTIYSPNITSDKETGIGNWTDEQFIKAMHDGISPEGHYYYPAFPYLYFNKITTEDLLAIKAYLQSMPPVHQKNHKNEMIWPFNWRFLQFGWRVLFFDNEKTGPLQSNPHESVEWNRGEYLVEGLAHCAMCHTPSYYIFNKDVSLGAPIRKYNLTGAQIQGYLAPNISSSNIGAIPTQEIIKVFTQNKMIGGGSIDGPMLEANHNSLSHLSTQDLTSIATYIKSVHSELPPKPTGKGIGKNVYDNYCSGCHASGGGGAPRYGDVEAWTPILKKGTLVIDKNAINGINGMPAKGTCATCSDDDIKKAVSYMIASVIGPDGKPKAAPQKPKRLTMEDGKQLYQKNCSVCHSTGYKNAPKPGDQTAWKPIIKEGFFETYQNVVTGKKGHLPRGACMDCTDAELIAAVKYMMQTSAPNKDYRLW